MNAADGGNGGGNGGGDDGGDSDGKSGARSDRSDKTTTSGSSGDTSGGSDSDIGNNNRFHPVGVDLRTDGQHNDSNDTTNKNAKKKKKKKIQKLPHPRTKMKWEMININWPDETNADEDANGDRIGHACAKYGEWLYVIGGCATGHTYKSDIFKLHVSELDVNNNNNFAFQSTPGCTYERCDPVQKYDDLYYNMMTPRAGHTVTARGSNFYIYGGGMDGFVEGKKIKKTQRKKKCFLILCVFLLFCFSLGFSLCFNFCFFFLFKLFSSFCFFFSSKLKKYKNKKRFKHVLL